MLRNAKRFIYANVRHYIKDMDEVINTLIEILSITDKKISELLIFSKYKVNQSSTFGTRVHSTLSTFEIISPPVQTAKLNALNEEEKEKIFNAVLLIFPVKESAPEISEVIYEADTSLSSTLDFVQIIRNEELVNDISVALNLLERKPPKFWIDFKNGKTNSLFEDDYRSEFFRMLGMKYQISSEEESKAGRTDLIIKSSSLNRKVFEFKIWKRNNYLKTSSQLLKYLTEIDDAGFVIMGNDSKTNSISESDYIPIIKCSEYISKSMKNEFTQHGYGYYTAEYFYKSKRKKIFHFILNLK